MQLSKAIQGKISGQSVGQKSLTKRASIVLLLSGVILLSRYDGYHIALSHCFSLTMCREVLPRA